MDLLSYQEPTINADTGDEITHAKHILKLDDISLINSNRSNTSAQSVNLPWLNQETNPKRRLVRQEIPHHVQKEVALHFHNYPN